MIRAYATTGRSWPHADKGMPTAAASIRREYVEASIAAELVRTAASSAVARQEGPAHVERHLQVDQGPGSATGLPGLHPHQLRYTFSHDWLANGRFEGDPMRLAGWGSRAILSRYAASAAGEHRPRRPSTPVPRRPALRSGAARGRRSANVLLSGPRRSPWRVRAQLHARAPPRDASSRADETWKWMSKGIMVPPGRASNRFRIPSPPTRLLSAATCRERRSS